MLAGPLRGWLAGRLAGWLGRPNALKACTLSQKVCRKHVPLGKKCVENTYPQAEHLFRSVKNTYPQGSAEGGKRRDEPGKENLELKNCIALVVI